MIKSILRSIFLFPSLALLKIAEIAVKLGIKFQILWIAKSSIPIFWMATFLYAVILPEHARRKIAWKAKLLGFEDRLPKSYKF